jgi:hypothetical protein
VIACLGREKEGFSCSPVFLRSLSLGTDNSADMLTDLALRPGARDQRADEGEKRGQKTKERREGKRPGKDDGKHRKDEGRIPLGRGLVTGFFVGGSGGSCART